MVPFPAAREHLARTRTDMLKYHICSRKSLARWMGGIGRESIALEKIAETALEHAPKANVERCLFLMDELYTAAWLARKSLRQ
jgi:hypothetical protein